MKKTLTLILLNLIFLSFAKAQNVIAKLKYEEAEKAYQGEYWRVEGLLNEAEKILKGTNPKIMYLRILVQNKFVDGEKSFGELERTRKLAEKYLKDYQNLPNNEDKYVEIYKIAENLNAKYPHSKEQFIKYLKENDKSYSEKAYKYLDTLFRSYGFASNSTESQFVSKLDNSILYPDIAKPHNKNVYHIHVAKNRNYFSMYDGYVRHYTFAVHSADPKVIFDKFAKEVLSKTGVNSYMYVYNGIMLKVNCLNYSLLVVLQEEDKLVNFNLTIN